MAQLREPRGARSLFYAVLLAAPLCALAADVELKTDDEKALYAYGAQFAQQLQFLELNEQQIATVIAGVNEGFANKPRIPTDDPAHDQRLQSFYRQQMQAVLKREDTASAQYATAAAAEKGAVKSDSGLIYRDLTVGKGETPKASDSVSVHYHGTLRDGTVFDSSRERNQPAEFPLTGVIPCWTEALQKMKVGGKAKLVCPAAIAYGDNGRPPKIKPGAALTFEVELLSVTKAPAETPAAAKPPSNPH
jgi:FKBP-type peptidyl-prolyl cis-trans isomerase FkpA